MNKEAKILTIPLNKYVNLLLVIEINEENNEVSLSNKKLNIRSVYETNDKDEAMHMYARFVIESLVEYAKEGILAKVFDSVGIRIRPGTEINEVISKQVKEIVDTETAMITQKEETVSLSKYKQIEENLSIQLTNVDNYVNWQPAIS